MSQVRHEEETDEYRVRPFRRDDADAFLDLYEAVWGRRRSRAWFEWRFADVPHLDAAPMVVVERDGRLVGAEPCLPFHLRAGSETALALQPADWMVHPDHRRRGLFTRMTDLLLERAPRWGPELFFNFPSAAVLPGLRKFDWRLAGTLPVRYRIAAPGALLRHHRDDPPGRTVSAATRLAGALEGGRHRALDALARVPDDVAVERYDVPPVGALVDCYRESVPERIHVARTPAFYRWRATNPRWETVTYLATRGGSPVAGLLACTETREGLRRTMLLDAVPLSGRDDRTGAFAGLVAAAVEDHRDADLLKVAEGTVPAPALRRAGFRRDASFPLSRLSTPTRMVTRPVRVDGAASWRFGGRRVDRVDEWALSLAGQDVA